MNIKELALPDGPIGVSVSGGADSAILLYFLMKHHKHKIYIVTVAARNKYLRSSKKSLDVVAKIVELTENEDYEHRIRYVNEQTRDTLFDELAQLYNSGSIIKFYTGVTANPPDEVTFSREHFSSLTTEDEERTPSQVRSINIGQAVVTPWTNIDKKVIARMFENEGLLDKLFPLTSSCEWYENMPYTAGIDPYKDHCGKCWWCEERLWGFGRLV